MHSTTGDVSTFGKPQKVKTKKSFRVFSDRWTLSLVVSWFAYVCVCVHTNRTVQPTIIGRLKRYWVSLFIYKISFYYPACERVHLSIQNCELYGFVPVPRRRSLQGKFPPNQAIIIVLSALKIELKSIAFITFYTACASSERGFTWRHRREFSPPTLCNG